MKLSRNPWPISEGIPAVKHQSSCSASVKQILSCKGHQHGDTKPSQGLPTESCASGSASRNLFPIFCSLAAYPADQPCQTCPVSKASTAAMNNTLARCRSQNLPSQVITGPSSQVVFSISNAGPVSPPTYLKHLSRNICNTLPSVCNIMWHR